MTRTSLPLPAPVSGGGHLVTVDGRALPLRAARLVARAAGGVATVKVVMTFTNPFTEVLQLRYLLPLPADGAVAGFAFTIGSRRIAGRIDRRAAAREAFERALVEGRTAGLLEEERSALFTQELGNVPPGVDVIAEVDVDQPLVWVDGQWEWRFPTAAAPRFHGDSGVVPDAARIDVPIADGELPQRLQVELAIDEPLAASGAPASTSHTLLAEAANGATAVRIGPSPLDRDVIVRWPVAAPTVGITLRGARPAALAANAHEAHGLLTLVPPNDGASLGKQARDVIVLLDVSGSMSGQPLAAAQRVVAALIESLDAGDQLELFAFANRTTSWRDGAANATPENKTAALRWLMALHASGGTQMHDAIVAALRPLRGDAQRQVVLVTDGQIGFEQQIVAEIRDRLPATSRVHVVGVGSAPNRTLTRSAARAGRGVEALVGLHDDAAAAAQRLCARTSAPLVTGLVVSGSALIATCPSAVPDLFAGAPVRLALRLRPEGGSVLVRGVTANGPYAHELRVQPMALGSGEPFVSRLAAREQVEDLEAAIAGSSDHAGHVAEIERIGMEFGIATRATSWIAVDSEVTVDPTAPRRITEIPHELAYGMSMQGLGLRRSMPAPGAAKMVACDVRTFDDEAAPGRSLRAKRSKARDSELREPMSAPAPFGGVHARLVLRDGATWTFDLHGFTAWTPPARVVIVLDDGTQLVADVVLERSTPGATLAPGLVARLVVRAAELATVSAAKPLVLRLGDGANAQGVPIA